MKAPFSDSVPSQAKKSKVVDSNGSIAKNPEAWDEIQEAPIPVHLSKVFNEPIDVSKYLVSWGRWAVRNFLTVCAVTAGVP